jgi:hypothetical protein
MGYATITRVPYIFSYEQALKKWQSTKPIRGREPELRPLGERRDCDSYSIRKNVWTEVVELVLYKTPVVKFTPDNEVILNFGPWSSSSTCQFISGVLQSVRTRRQQGEVVLEFKDGSKAMLGQHQELTLVRDAHGSWTPKVKQTLYDYRVNRKEANNVRGLVSQFHDYLAGVVKLKTEVTYSHGSCNKSVSTTYADLIEVFGEIKQVGGSGYIRPDVEKWVRLSEKPRHYRPEHKAEKWAEYQDKTRKFFDLVRNDQDDNTRHQNYWIAFNILFVQTDSFYWRNDTSFRVSMHPSYFGKVLDEALLVMFSDKVFNKVALAEGKVPSGRYDNYVLGEED